MKLFRILLAIAFCFVLTSPAFGSVGVKNSGSTIGTATDIDFSTNIDASNDGSTTTVTLSNTPTITGNLTFKSSLVAIGQEGGASTVSSSSTDIDPFNQGYTVVRKCVGGNSGLDETGVGTILQNGSAGQILVLFIETIDTDGSWVVTPVTSLMFANITFDAVGDMATLLYVNDTVGWIIISSEAITIGHRLTYP